MRKLFIAVIAATSLLAIPATVQAAPCKDAKGKFMKCPPPKPAATPKKGPCKDAKGKFTKCPK